jgi:beta-lactamase superfamily II metal-dependent hydrolase
VRLTVFQSDKGDCLLIAGKDGGRILADGGMRDSYKAHVAPALGKLHKGGKALDLVYVSHIDRDHISGVLQLMDDLVDWRVHEYHVASGNAHHKPPKSPRPPDVKAIWHNSFHAQVGKNSGPIERMLAANAAVLSLGRMTWQMNAAEEAMNLVASRREALQLSRRIGAKQLDIPLNQDYGGGLMFVSEPVDAITVGSLSVCVIGPFVEDLQNLRKEWNDWLQSQKGQKAVAAVRRRARRAEERLQSGELDDTSLPILRRLEALGDREQVTTPNLASLMLFIEEDGKTLLMTGDGHWEDVLSGLDAAGRLDANGRIHVNVLKVQHHGSEHNTSEEFSRRVTADHYVFCGNGADHNPDTRVVRTYIDSRTGVRSQRSRNAEVNRPFKLWFNSCGRATSAKRRQHMEKLERQVKSAASGSNGRLTYTFSDKSSVQVII